MSVLASLTKFIGVVPKAETPEEDELQRMLAGRPMVLGWFVVDSGERIPVLLPRDYCEDLGRAGCELVIRTEKKRVHKDTEAVE